MRFLMAAAVLFTSGHAFAQPTLPQGLKIERRAGTLTARLGAPMLKKSLRSAATLDGTWFASLKIGDDIHNFPVEIGQYPTADDYVTSFMYRQPLADGTPFYGNGFAWEDVSHFVFAPRWGDASFFCLMAKVEDKYEADCENPDTEAHLTLKPMSADQPFRFKPVVANVNVPPQKDEDQGVLLFNSYQTAVEHNHVATVEGSDEAFMDFSIVFEAKDATLGIGGVLNLKAALEDSNRAFVPYFASTLDGTYAEGRLTAVTKFERLSTTPLVLYGANEDTGLHYVISEPEN